MENFVIVSIISVITVFVYILLKDSFSQSDISENEVSDRNESFSNSDEEYQEDKYTSGEIISENISIDDNPSNSTNFTDEITDPTYCYLPYNIHHDDCFNNDDDTLSDYWDNHWDDYWNNNWNDDWDR
ncbi:MAG: hypothetical protein DSY47_04435 [Hydrogenothermus sp.]|nr:MAG: hypothetical protein DSY47_04435 [Hydrogenothermus sp.]